MAKFSKMQVMAAMKETGMVPVFFNKDIEICKNVIKACYEGGVRVFEFTNTGNAPLIITNVQSTCGCTVPSKPKEPIMPGKSDKIEVKYNIY